MDSTKKVRPPLKLPRFVIIIICVFPAVITILFYSLLNNKSAMGWAAAHISAPIRKILGLINSIYPFSMMEVLIAVAVVWLVYFIVKTIIITVRTSDKLKHLSKRLLTVLVVVLYLWGLFCWLWNSGYHGPGFAEKNGFSGGGVSIDELASVTAYFAEKANEYALLVERDDDGHYIGDRREFFKTSTSIYQNIVNDYPGLEGRSYKPKAMLFSWLMSRTGYTGIYFAYTGESSININAPLCLMPATIAHELAHQRGVYREDEANFVGIVACVTSDSIAYMYAGYLLGLMHLMSALAFPAYELWAEINGSLNLSVITDMQDNNEFWRSQEKVETGIEFFDNVLTSLTEVVSDTVDTVYDGFLKSQNQELGLRTYGACVDLLVEHYSR